MHAQVCAEWRGCLVRPASTRRRDRGDRPDGGRLLPSHALPLEAAPARAGRQRRWTAAELELVRQTRLRFPLRGRAKIRAVLAREHGFAPSESATGRMIARLVRTQWHSLKEKGAFT